MKSQPTDLRKAWKEHTRLDLALTRMIRREIGGLKTGYGRTTARSVGERAQPIQLDKINKARWKEVCTRRGRQMTPVAFTRHMVDTHQQWAYPPIPPRKFTPPPNFERRVLEAIKRRSPNKAVSSDGVLTEMLQVHPDTCAEILTSWWTALARLSMFPEQ